VVPQLVRGTLLDELATVHYEDLIGIQHRAEPLGDPDQRPTLSRWTSA
jgi:hypothetical protein